MDIHGGIQSKFDFYQCWRTDLIQILAGRAVWCWQCRLQVCGGGEVGTTGKARQGAGDRSLTNHFQTGLAVSCHQLVSQSDLCWPLDMQTLNVIHYVGLTISWKTGDFGQKYVSWEVSEYIDMYNSDTSSICSAQPNTKSEYWKFPCFSFIVQFTLSPEEENKKKVQNGCGLDPLSFTMCSGTVTGPSQSATVMLRKMWVC